MWEIRPLLVLFCFCFFSFFCSPQSPQFINDGHSILCLVEYLIRNICLEIQGRCRSELGNPRASQAALNWFISDFFLPHVDWLFHRGYKAISELNPPPHQSRLRRVTVNEVNRVTALYVQWYQRKEKLFTKGESAPWTWLPSCLWLTEPVRNSRVMWGPSMNVYVRVRECVCVQAQTCKDGLNRCLEYTHTHTHNLRYPTFQDKAEPTSPSSSHPSSETHKAPKHFDCEIHLHKPANSETLVGGGALSDGYGLCCMEDEVTTQMHSCSASLSFF